MSGLSESKQTHVHLKNVDAATLQIIITYAYTGNLALSDSTVEPLYETACFLQVCTHFLWSLSLIETQNGAKMWLVLLQRDVPSVF